MVPDIRIGTSGWHYPTGATWNGVFYPKPRPKGFDELAFYAEYFDTVEINTTFYGQPRAEIAAKWVERTPQTFLFSLKLYQQFTHPRMFAARVTKELAKQLGTDEIPPAVIDALIQANQADLDEFHRGIEPLANAGKLGALLLQFPASFHDSPASRAHLAALLRAFHDHQIAIELRHRSWSDNAAATKNLLNAFGTAWVWIDEPKFTDSVRQPEVQAGAFLYVRLHGRNAKAWWKGSNDERYNYLYSPQELTPIAEDVTWKRGFLYTNNHANARSVVNALQLKEALGQSTEVALPDALIAAHPVLVGVGASRAERAKH